MYRKDYTYRSPGHKIKAHTDTIKDILEVLELFKLSSSCYPLVAQVFVPTCCSSLHAKVIAYLNHEKLDLLVMNLLLIQCGVNVLVNMVIGDISSIVNMCSSCSVNVTYMDYIFTNTFTPHLINGKFIVNPTFPMLRHEHQFGTWATRG